MAPSHSPKHVHDARNRSGMIVPDIQGNRPRQLPAVSSILSTATDMASTANVASGAKTPAVTNTTWSTKLCAGHKPAAVP